MLDRRRFFTWSVGGAFLLTVGGARAETAGANLTPWITIQPNGRVTLVSTAVDMGQGARTGQAQILADELDVAWEAVSVEMAPDADPFRWEGELYSGGSQSIATRYQILRLAAATARAQLVAAAAARWQASHAECGAALGSVTHRPSGRMLSYGDLASEAAAIPPPAQPPLKSAAQRRHVGQPLPGLGVRAKVTGATVYGIDFRLPGMLFASIRQCPTFGGGLASVDPAPAMAIAGVGKVVRLPAAVAVIASSTWVAFKAAGALEPKWTAPRAPPGASIPDLLAKGQDGPGAMVRPTQGGAAARETLRAAYAKASRKLEATYDLAFLAHAPLEPMNATARVTDRQVELWAPCQAQTAGRKAVAEALGRPLEEVVLHVTNIGGGFGRRLQTDYLVQAALIAREADAPVQLVWTREEDFAHDFYRPASRMTFRGALDKAGRLAGYEVVTATADDYTGGFGPAPYALAPYAATLSNVATGTPIGPWRAVDPGMSLFAKESFIDEAAHLAGADPLAFRLAMLGDNPRAARVLNASAQAIGWSDSRASGVGRGVALLHEWNTVVAHAVEVQVAGERLTVRRIVVAADPGLVINPAQSRGQFEGGGLMALSAALGEAMTFEGGRAVQTNFDAYPILRLRQAPTVTVILLESEGAPVGGCGEPPVPGVAPALANAIFAACGRRIRSLPISKAGFKV